MHTAQMIFKMPQRKNKRHHRYTRRRLNIKKGQFRHKVLLSAFILLVVVIFFIFLLCRWADSFFATSPFFNVSKIELTMRPILKEALSLDFYNIPRQSNIFKLAIDEVSINTQKKHPEFKSVVILRKPPNVMSVKIEYKQPVAFIKTNTNSRFFYGAREISYNRKEGYALIPVAIDGVVLPSDIAVGRILPTLSGVDFKTTVIKVGSICSDKKLAYGLKFLSAVESFWSIKNHRIDAVNLNSTKNISILLENGIEVKMGDSRIKEDILTLKDILEGSRFDLAKIKYIDLRFSDVIIGPR